MASKVMTWLIDHNAVHFFVNLEMYMSTSLGNNPNWQRQPVQLL